LGFDFGAGAAADAADGVAVPFDDADDLMSACTGTCFFVP